MPPWGFETLCTAGATACNNPLLVFTNDENNNTNGRGTCVTHNHLLSLPPWRHTMIICHSLCLLPRDTPSPVCHWSRHCWGELGSWGEEQLIDPVPAFPPPRSPSSVSTLSSGGWVGITAESQRGFLLLDWSNNCTNKSKQGEDPTGKHFLLLGVFLSTNGLSVVLISSLQTSVLSFDWLGFLWLTSQMWPTF